MNSCKQIADIIGPYLYGETTQSETDDMEEHLRSCKHCKSDINERRRCIAALAPETPTPAERERIMRAVRTRIVADSVHASRSRMVRVLRLSVAMAVALVLFAAGIWMGQHHKTEKPIASTVNKAPAHVVTAMHSPTANNIHANEPKINPNSIRPAKKLRPVLSASNGRTTRHWTAGHGMKPVNYKSQPQIQPVSPEEFARETPQPTLAVAPIPLGVDDARVVAIEEHDESETILQN